jgi:hypothetical protein
VGFFILTKMEEFHHKPNCLIIAHLSNKAKKHQKWSYGFVEWLGIVTAKIVLKNTYNRIVVCNAKGASFAQIKREIAIFSKYESLDIILNVHGLKTGIFLFDNEFIPISTFCEIFKQHNLRLVYSTACYGKYHLQEWMNVNAKSAIGATAVNGNALSEYPFFLHYWKIGFTSTDALQRASFYQLNRIQDKIARKIFGFKDVDSSKTIIGKTTIQS